MSLEYTPDRAPFAMDVNSVLYEQMQIDPRRIVINCDKKTKNDALIRQHIANSYFSLHPEAPDTASKEPLEPYFMGGAISVTSFIMSNIGADSSEVRRTIELLPFTPLPSVIDYITDERGDPVHDQFAEIASFRYALRSDRLHSIENWDTQLALDGLYYTTWQIHSAWQQYVECQLDDFFKPATQQH